MPSAIRNVPTAHRRDATCCAPDARNANAASTSTPGSTTSPPATMISPPATCRNVALWMMHPPPTDGLGIRGSLTTDRLIVGHDAAHVGSGAAEVAEVSVAAVVPPGILISGVVAP